MKNFSMILALVLLCSMLPLAVFAADAPVASIGSATAKAGEEITLTVNMANNPGIVGAQLYVGYDANVMTYVSAKAGTSSFYFSASTEQGANPVKLVLANLSLQEVSGDFKVAEITFKINEDAKAGEYTVSLSSVEAYDKDIAPVAFAAKNGSVTVKSKSTNTSVGTGTVHKHSYKETVVAAAGAEPGYTLHECSCGHAYKDNYVYGDAAKFVKAREYTGSFVDVPEANWYYEYVKLAYEYALANGTSTTKFSPDNKFTVAQALTAAVNIHKAYYAAEIRAAAAGEKWYDPYVEYCVEKGIITDGQFSNMDKNITRGEMAIVFANILPDSEYAVVRNGAPVDVAEGSSAYLSVKKLYEAGIVSGDAGKGTYRPDDEIVRSEACVIFTRFAAVDKRAK